MTKNGATPTIKFRTIRYCHKLEQQELAAKIEAGEATEEDDTRWLMSMVTDWDLKDVETGDPIPVGEYKPLSLVQHAAVLAAWDSYAEQNRAEVKKTRKLP